MAASQIDDPVALAGDEVLSWSAGEPSPVVRVLGHDERWRGAAPIDGGLLAAYELTRWLETRCVQLFVTVEGVRTEVDRRSPCAPRRDDL